MPSQQFSKDILRIDPEKEADKICSQLRSLLSKQFKRRGYVVGLSGGIDSSVTAALSAKSIGPNRVLALLMPERYSSEDTLSLSLYADRWEIKTMELVGARKSFIRKPYFTNNQKTVRIVTKSGFTPIWLELAF